MAQIIHKNKWCCTATVIQSYESGLHNHNNHHFPFHAITCSHAGMLEFPQLPWILCCCINICFLSQLLIITVYTYRYTIISHIKWIKGLLRHRSERCFQIIRLLKAFTKAGVTLDHLFSGTTTMEQMGWSSCDKHFNSLYRKLQTLL